MRQFTLTIAIFDQESFEEAIADFAKIVDQHHMTWNYEKVILSTDLGRTQLAQKLDEVFDDQLDYIFD